MTINIILYILLGVGVGYFVYLVYRKWPELQKQDKPKFNLSVDDFKSFFKRMKYSFKNLPNKLKAEKINLEKIKLFFVKTAKSIKGFVTKSLAFDRDVISTVIKKIKNTFFKIKPSPSAEFEFKKLGKVEKKIEKDTKEKKQEQKIKKKELPKTKNIKEKSQKLLKNIQNKTAQVKESFVKLMKKIKQTTSKISLGKAKNFIQVIKDKVKTRFISEEDEKAKKRFQEKEEETKTQKETYLGDLLQKTIKQSTKKEEKKEKTPPKEMSAEKEDILEKEVLEEKQQKPKTLQEGIEKLSQADIKTESKATKEKKTTEQVSQESLDKIEQDLVQQILDDPKNIEAYKRLGRLYFNQGKYSYAKESFDAAIKLGSGDKKIKELLEECDINLQDKKN